MSYTMNLFHNPSLGPVWSLSVEEQFYLFWPLLLSGLLALRDRHRGRWIVGLLLFGIIAPAVLRVVLWTGPESVPSLYMCTHTRLDGLSAGCLVGVLAAWGLLRPATRWGRWGLQAAAWAAVAVLTVAVFSVHNYDRLMYHGGFTVVSLCAAVLVAALVGSPPPLLSRLLGVRPLRWVGRISYGLYLWHTPVIIAVLHYVPIADFTTKCVLAWIPCLAAGALSHYCVELPFLRLKERLGRERPVAEPQPLLKAAA
jgi:peptidoglycan/LPS O-acetylase OafA/YrhL